MADPRATGELPQTDVAQLVGDYHQVLYRYAYRLTGAVADAEDLTQQTFLVAQQKLGQLRQIESVRSWLFTILRNCYLKGFRRQLPMSPAGLELCIDEIPDPSGEEEIDRQQLQAALNTLPDEFKLVLLLFYFEEQSYQEIAQQLEIPIGTVMSRLSRGKSHLRKALAARQAPIAPPLPCPPAQAFVEPNFPEINNLASDAKRPNIERPVVVRR